MTKSRHIKAKFIKNLNNFVLAYNILFVFTFLRQNLT